MLIPKAQRMEVLAMAQAIKFLHASDLHLDRAISSLAEIPPHLKSTLVNAAYTAAENIFNLAVAEKVDFVLLAGDVLDLEAGGPRAAAFLLTQFERLAQRDIRVYWCSGQVDQPDRWPAAVALPNNVVTFSSTGFEESVCIKNSQAIATIFGTGFYSSRSTFSDLRIESSAAFPIALAYEPSDKPIFEAPGIRYWALGGKHERSLVERNSSFVVAPGTPQARCAEEIGQHSCALVKVDVTGKIRVDYLPVDVVRWAAQKLAFAESASDEEIKNLLADRGLKMAIESPEQVVFVDWQITTTGDFNPRLRSSEWRRKMIAWLRTEFGSSTKGLWATNLEIDPSRTLPQTWYDEDTMMGDYLRTISRFQADPQMSLQLQPYVSGNNVDEWLGDMTRIDETTRAKVLRDATLFGIERLGAFVEKE